MTTPQQQILDKCKEVFALATRLYGVDMSNVSVHFDLKGRAAGMACRRASGMYMRFNRDMLTRDAFDHVLNNTVPHEIAHIVCFMNSSLGRGHDGGWARVCAQLGGNATRCHSEKVVYGKGTTYEYITTNGHEVRVSDKVHRNIQKGTAYTFKHGRGRVTATCTYSIVGHQGRTLAEPIVRPATTVAPAVNPIVAQARQSFTIGVPAVEAVARAVGGTKEQRARNIMEAGVASGTTQEHMISAIMLVNECDRARARSLFSFCAKKFSIVV